MMAPPIEAVTFDVTHTLIHSPRLGEIYAEVLGRHGVEVEPDDAARLVRLVWQELACSAEPGRDRFTAHPDGPRGWWGHFLTRLCELLDAPVPSRFAAAELFARFARPDAWEVYPEVRATLAALRWRGVRLGVVSNWDHRLPQVLAALGLAERLDVITYSSEVGVEKPDPRIFAAALSRLGVEPQAALHVGDGRLEDVDGALAAGVHPVLLARGTARVGLAAAVPVVRDLSEVPALLQTTAAAGPAVLH
jgi:putative hydrolase of the HAD superfamily